MKQHHIAGRCLAEIGQHGFEIHVVTFRIVVTVFGDFEPGGLENTDVVGPGRIGDPDAARANLATEQFGRDSQPAGAARSLRGLRAPFGDDWRIGTEQQLLHRERVVGGARNTEVGFAVFGVEQALFRFFDRIQYRRFAVFVLVDTNAEIDLVAA